MRKAAPLPAREETPAPPPKPKSDCCSRVIDGRTIELLRVDGTSSEVRLLGVDAPARDSKLIGILSPAQMAQDFVADLLVGEEIRIETEPSFLKDRDGKSLAYVYRRSDGKLANEAVISHGYAEVSKDYPFKRQEQFRLAQEEARTRLLGIWGILNTEFERQKRQLVADEKIAKRWMAIGANLEKRNPPAARTWYQKVVDKFPDVPSSNEAREKLRSVQDSSSPKK
jgi:endonuclease YncB( thermonuclease family)